MNSSEKNARYKAVRRKRRLLIISNPRGRGQDVAFAAAGVDQAAPYACVELAAQALDVDVDDVRERVEVFVPHMLRNLFPAHHAALVQDQVFEKGVLLGGEVDILAGARDAMAAGIENEVGDVYYPEAQAGGAAEQGTEAGEKFLEIERLGEVIVSAGIEARDAIVHRAARGQHEDGSAKSGG